MLNDVIGGQLHCTFLSYSTIGQHITAGRLRALAVTSATRAGGNHDIPTIAEQGYPDYDATPWWGFAVPAATPRPLVARLHVDVVRAVQSADVKDRFVAQGLEVIGNTPEQMDAFLRAEVVRWAKVVKAANIKPD